MFPGLIILENVRACGRPSAYREAPAVAVMLWTPDEQCAEERELRKRADAMAMLELAGLAKFPRDAHAVDSARAVHKSCLKVVRALMSKPKLLCLDEPAAGLNDTETDESLATPLRANRAADIAVSRLKRQHVALYQMNAADYACQSSRCGNGELRGRLRLSKFKSNAKVVDAILGRGKKMLLLELRCAVVFAGDVHHDSCWSSINISEAVSEIVTLVGANARPWKSNYGQAHLRILKSLRKVTSCSSMANPNGAANGFKAAAAGHRRPLAWRWPARFSAGMTVAENLNRFVPTASPAKRDDRYVAEQRMEFVLRLVSISFEKRLGDVAGNFSGGSAK